MPLLDSNRRWKGVLGAGREADVAAVNGKGEFEMEPTATVAASASGSVLSAGACRGRDEADRRSQPRSHCHRAVVCLVRLPRSTAIPGRR